MAGNYSKDDQLLKVWKLIKQNKHGKLSLFYDQLLSLWSQLLQSLLTALHSASDNRVAVLNLMIHFDIFHNFLLQVAFHPVYHGLSDYFLMKEVIFLFT